MIGTRALALTAACAAAAAAAGTHEAGDASDDAFPTAGTRYESRLLSPGTTDARLGVLADLLLSKASAVVVVDRGLAPIGTGSLALGLEVAGGKCLLACGRIS